MSNIKLLDLEAVSVPMELNHPTKGLLGVTLEVLGPDSPEYRNLRNNFLKRRIAQGEKVTIDIDEVTEQNNELLATCVVGWSDDEMFGGPFSKEKMIEILKNIKLSWLRDQLSEFTDERKNFFR
jgi:hypothetical protein